ncbi:MAG TPA: DNA recombination protein RmuC, partial [Saprospiraceae bacterium]|nr:DNA recombination protein RmuC [Saprospiraceae bacterium]
MSESLLLGCILLSLLIGGLIGWLLARLRVGKDNVGPSELAKRYVLREVHEQLQQQWETQKTDLQEKETAIRQLTANVAAHQQDLNHLQEKLGQQQQEVERLQQQAQITFENIANRLLDEKSIRFVASNQQQMQELLQPLREKIKDFEESIERKFLDEAKDRISLKTEIEQLRTLNQQLSQDAHSLAEALKGDSKTQGDWGELRLEVLLEQAGLQKHIHYRTQQSFTDADGQQKRPDVIVDLPEGKHLI